MESKQKETVKEDGTDEEEGGFVLEEEPRLDGVAAAIEFAVKKGHLERKAQVGQRVSAQLQAMQSNNAIRETLTYEYDLLHQIYIIINFIFYKN